MYGSQQPVKSSSHNNSGPSAPEWRPSTTMNNSQQQTWHPPSSSPPAPPLPVSVSMYNPNVYGPMPAVSPVHTQSVGAFASGPAMADTTSWGVRFNQHSQAEIPPPLPPRPPSTAGLFRAHVQSPVDSPPPDWRVSTANPPWTPPSAVEPQSQWHVGGVSDLSHQFPGGVPPPPPPVPPGYREEILQQSGQEWQHPPNPAYHHASQIDTYGQQLSSVPQQVPPPVPAKPLSPPIQTSSSPFPGNGSAHHSHPPHFMTQTDIQQSSLGQQMQGWYPQAISSEPGAASDSVWPAQAFSSLANPAASALGAGGPSDWEHFGPPPSQSDGTDVVSPTSSVSMQSTPVSALPPATSAAADSIPVHSPSQGTGHPSHPSFPSQIQHPHAQATLQKLTTPYSSVPPTHDIHGPTRPSRMDSVRSSSSIVSVVNSERFDNIIEAWNRPISPEERAPAVSDRQDSLSHFVQTLSPHPKDDNGHSAERINELPSLQDYQVSEIRSPVEIRSPTAEPSPRQVATVSSTTIRIDPYEDLDPWSKSSLERYVAMLRKEAVVDSDEERFKIFTSFTAKETKLREVLYSIESEPKADAVPVPAPVPVQAPAPVATEDPIPAQEPSTGEPAKPQITIDSGLIPVETESLSTVNETPSASDSEDDDEEGRYSPGGRPILRKVVASRKKRSSGRPPHTTSHPPAPVLEKTGASETPGPRAASQTGTGGTSTPDGKHSNATSVRCTLTEHLQKHTYEPLATNPPQPIYTPFRYTEGPQRGSDNLAFDRPAYQAYSALRQASAESGRLMSTVAPSIGNIRASSTTPGPAQTQHDETFVGLIREKSVAYHAQVPRRASIPPSLPEVVRPDHEKGPLDELRALVSTHKPRQTDSSVNIATPKDLENLTDDFAYIEDRLASWEQTAAARREQVEKERISRQEESEASIDDLFNAKEIGYADINILEEDFRQAEARVQLDEERQELNDFILNVFNPLDQRLKDEISKLKSHYDSVLSGIDQNNSDVQVSQVMKAANVTSKRLEMRYQKRLDLALDRERRRKKAERRPLVFMGNPTALKQLDCDFDKMEKQNILQAARDRDDRANRLMDSFDDAILRGLGENQKLVDEISTKISKLDPEKLRRSGSSTAEIEQLLQSVFLLITSLLTDSESILHCFGVADSTLNEADYGVSVAEARYTNADEDIFTRLEEEKLKEDAKIRVDLKSKLESVRKHPRQITGQIDTLLEAVKGAPSSPTPPPLQPPVVVVEPPPRSETAPLIQQHHHPLESLIPGPGTGLARPGTAGIPTTRPTGNNDSEHQERLRRALEEAKRRNAARMNSA